MSKKPVYIGDTKKRETLESVTGELVTLRGEEYYRIGNYDRMRPFFMTIVSDSDHWMFLSSNGALTAGRKNPEHALFPYSTDDKIHDSRDLTGGKTLFLVEKGDRCLLWEPFSAGARDAYDLQRNLYKSVHGNRILFEEVNRDLSLTFCYAWTHSEEFGFVKWATLRNQGSAPVALRLLDGLQNLLPAGVNRFLQTERSTLLDAYKKNELLEDSGLGLFVLSSVPVDRPEPSEALRATTVWSEGLENPLRLVSALQLERFRQGLALKEETDVRAERGAYFVHAALDLEAEGERDWYLVAETDQGPAEVTSLSRMLVEDRKIRAQLERSIDRGTERLKRIVASADGLQLTRQRLSAARHFSNVLFNVMRGGVFHDNHMVDVADLKECIHHHDGQVARRSRDFLNGLPESLPAESLLEAAHRQGDAQLERLCYEYLPLAFSRRHGDPSRPWNEFSIETRREDGKRNLYYQGNWRDIFQNWEALSRSFPTFVEGMICKFLNASTADGYNPYRITRDGIDWEVVDPDDPWSHIGYWGDHQVIYLLKLLEISRDHHPGTLETLLTRDLFAYANVPYRIKPYEELLADPHDTIIYDAREEERIAERVRGAGADGKLVWNSGGEVVLVNLAEKLLVLLLAKLSNFIPGAGIWMNTQRPEWNDANNALVGYGVSMVTLYYLRRFQSFAVNLFQSVRTDHVDVSEEVVDLLAAISRTFDRHRELLGRELSDRDRKTVLDALGEAGSAYRRKIYERGFSGRRKRVPRADLLAFFELALAHVDHSIRANRREDGLFHAYNLMSVEGHDRISLRRLYEMLEGQVAVLTSGCLSARDSVDLLAALRSSALYREDQRSYLLYPDRRLPRFTEKNRIPAESVARSDLMRRLLEDGDRHLIVQGSAGTCHFNGDFRNAGCVSAALDWLRDHGYRGEVARDRAYVLEMWEDLFDHRSYTGRSGTFFGYEGLGCIYWHMVSKLELAVQETYFRLAGEGERGEALSRIAGHYHDIREGIGVTKNPAEYGAFPIDPYSHTPGNAGVQQPGMTGQVKEDILARWGELGVVVSRGRIRFQPALLSKEEFLTGPARFTYYDTEGIEQTLELATDTLAFTYCQVPVVYRRSGEPRIVVTHHDGAEEEIPELELDASNSASVFGRRGEIRSIDVALRPGR